MNTYSHNINKSKQDHQYVILCAEFGVVEVNDTSENVSNYLYSKVTSKLSKNK